MDTQKFIQTKPAYYWLGNSLWFLLRLQLVLLVSHYIAFFVYYDFCHLSDLLVSIKKKHH